MLKSPRFTFLHWIVMGIPIAIVAALLLATPQRVWSGSIQIALDGGEFTGVEKRSVLLAHCWRTEQLADNVTEGTYNFRPAQWSDGRALTRVPVSGRCDYLGHVDTYHQPKHLIVLYRLEGATEVAHETLTIPTDRGDKVLKIHREGSR